MGKGKPRVAQPIRAYHGSPHDFDRFDFSKIGTGEGNQSYGHGGYFASDDEVADFYRRTLSRLALTPEQDALELWRRAAEKSGDKQRAVLDALDYAEGALADASHPKAREVWEQVIQSLYELDFRQPLPQKPGRAYEVDIDASPSDLLNYDRFTAGDAGLRAAQVLRQVSPREIDGSTLAYLEKRPLYSAPRSGSPLESAERGIRRLTQTPEGAELLRQAGIPGIRYTGQGRGQNFVMFPGTEDLIRIVRKYGFIPPAIYAAGQAATASAESPMATIVAQELAAGPSPQQKSSGGTAQSKWSSQDNSMAINPLEWEDWYRARAQGDDPDHERFRANVATVLHTPYVRRDVAATHGAIGTSGVEADLTPLEFMDGVLASWFIPEDQRQEIIDNASAALMGEPLDDESEGGKMGRQMAKTLLDVMRSQTPGNEKAKDASVSQQQFDQWQQQEGNDANFRLTQDGQQNFSKQAAYDLLRAMQDGEHAPPYANSMSQGLSWIGGWFDDVTSDNYNDLANSPGPLGRAKVANRWWDQSNMSRGRFRGDTFSDNAHFPGWSSTTMEGLGRIMSEDTSNALARATVPFQRFFSPSEANRTPQGDSWMAGGRTRLLDGLNDATKDFRTANEIEVSTKRTTPINPGFSPSQFRQVLASRADLQRRGQDFERSFWPDVQAAKDRVLGTRTPRSWGTPLTESVMKLPQNTLGDPITAGFTAASAGGGAVMGGLAGAGKGAGALARTANAVRGGVRGAGAGLYAAGADIITDAPTDLATEQAIGSVGYDSFGDWVRSLREPLRDNAMMGRVQPGDPNLPDIRAKKLEAYDDEWQRLIQSWEKAKANPRPVSYPVQNR